MYFTNLVITPAHQLDAPPAGRPQWSESYGGGAMFAPVAFCFIFVLVLTCGLVLYIGMALLKQIGLLPPAAPLPLEEQEQVRWRPLSSPSFP